MAKKISTWFRELLTIDHSFNNVIAKCIYALVVIDFVVIILPYIGIEGLTIGQNAILKINSPDHASLVVMSEIIKDLHLYIIGSYVFKVLGKQATQAIVAIACVRTGADVVAALNAIKDGESVQLVKDPEPEKIETPSEEPIEMQIEEPEKPKKRGKSNVNL